MCCSIITLTKAISFIYFSSNLLRLIAKKNARKLGCTYFSLSNNRTVWNNGIGWKFPGRKINVGYGIIILGGKFTLKITSNLYFRPKKCTTNVKIWFAGIADILKHVGNDLPWRVVLTCYQASSLKIPSKFTAIVKPDKNTSKENTKPALSKHCQRHNGPRYCFYNLSYLYNYKACKFSIKETSS